MVQILTDKEAWKVIDEFPNYRISSRGFVFNIKMDDFMKLSRTQQGDYKVTLVNDEYRVTRSVRVLVAEAFVQKPDPMFDTVIILDTDKSNIVASNLAWRPRWFAWKYYRQFYTPHHHNYTSIPIINLNTKVKYSSVIDAAMREGVLLEDLWRSVNNGSFIFPTGDAYAVL